MTYQPLGDGQLFFPPGLRPQVDYLNTLEEQVRRANRLADTVERMKADGTSPTFRELFEALAAYRGKP